jgi:iron complex outermembrane receptor protein
LKNEFLGDFDYTDKYPLVADPLGGRIGSHTADRQSLDAASIEARLQTKLNGAINFMIGGYYQHQKLNFEEAVFFPDGPANSAAPSPDLKYVTVLKDSQSTGDTYAVFGQALVDITPTLNLTGGLRYTHESKDSTFSQPYVHPFYASTFVIDTIGAKQSFNNVSPEATITWKPQPNLTVYGSYKTGYKSGGYSISGLITANTAQSDAAFGPEKVGGFEGGVKSTLLDNQLRLNADLFWYNYKGVQVDFFVADVLQYFTLNAGRLRNRGGEIQAEFAPRALPGFTMNAAAAYTDAIYTRFPFAPCIAAQSPAEGCQFGATPTGIRNFQNLKGQRPASAPKWTATLDLGYALDLLPETQLVLNGAGRYSAGYKTYAFANAFADRFDQKKFITIDASVRLVSKNAGWELGLLAKNLTNRFIVTQAVDAPFTGSGTGTATGVRSDVDGSIADPRSVFVQAVYGF